MANHDGQTVTIQLTLPMSSKKRLDALEKAIEGDAREVVSQALRLFESAVALDDKHPDNSIWLAVVEGDGKTLEFGSIIHRERVFNS